MSTRIKPAIFFAVVILAGVLSPGSARAAGLYVCDDPQIVGASAAFDVTPDGIWVVGTTNGRVFRWSASAGLEILSPSEWLHTHTAGVSDDGTMITSTVADDLGIFQPSRWIEGTGWEPLGGLPGEPPLDGSFGSGWDISGDGSVVVGLGWHSTYRAEGFRWDAASGVVGLGRPAGRNSRATAISADGSVIVGFDESESAGYRRPARWIEGGTVDLFLGEETYGETDSTSSDGRTLVGQYAHVSMVMAIGFTFTDTVGATPLLPILDGDYQESYAGGVSDSGCGGRVERESVRFCG